MNKSVCVIFRYGDGYEWQEHDVPIPPVGSSVVIWTRELEDGTFLPLGSRERGHAIARGVVSRVDYIYERFNNNIFTTYAMVTLSAEIEKGSE